MKKTVLAALLMTAVIALAGCGSDKPAETEAVSEDPVVVQQTQQASDLAPVIASNETTAPAAPAFPTGIPLDQDAYQEFSEPAMYEVIEDCVTWSGNDVQTSGGDLVQGSLVTGVASDGYYLILDDQRVVELTHVQLFE